MLTPDRKPSREPAAKSDELLGKIIEIVRRTGLAGFSLDTLAAELGTSSRMLVYYFGSKDELLGRIVYTIRDDTVKALASAPPSTIVDAIDAWWNYYRANLPDMQFFFHLTSRSFEEPDKFREFSSTAVEQWVAYFHRSLQGACRDDEEARAVARLVLATVRGLMVDLLITGDRQHVEQSLGEFKSLMRKSHVEGSATSGG
ncbi:TetR/AcrR family transcriptional regulator [Rhizohabitans arisaemae]|uniref:TetR/AcrR family transcriptional regulator n=1 Tax=Rhizohabitans arisaemae TaxID=2720610 RepID=UPI0024B070A6|nr:TetR/AcrR family transcriptional regulator [Rhizohabitans arisaemae]